MVESVLIEWSIDNRVQGTKEVVHYLMLEKSRQKVVNF